MEQTWRWYGPDDPVTLADIKQAGATGVVTALHHIPIGAVWPAAEIAARKDMIESAGLTWSVVESIPVHESIKTGKPEDACTKYTLNYAESLRNVAKFGKVDIFCYNFMPVVDWTRTDLDLEWSKDGSRTLGFDMVALAAFDLHILRKEAAVTDYTKEEREAAEKRFCSMTPEDRDRLVRTVAQGLPGRTSEAYTVDTLKVALTEYAGVGEERLRENLAKFLRVVAPVAEELGVFLALHPDDPPRSLLGLPRVVCTAPDLRKILASYPSEHNGLTMCVGSFASRDDNDVVAMVSEFARNTNFVHLRNVEKKSSFSFVESGHLEGDVDMYEVIKILLKERDRRKKLAATTDARVRMPMRPDHGHRMLDDLTSSKKSNPGYTAIGRLRGLAELRGLQLGIIRSNSQQQQDKC